MLVRDSMYEFPKENRLLKRLEFKTALNHGVKVVDPNLVMLGCKTNNQRDRIGLIVSKKVGNAVTRNRVKRRLRESFRLRAAETTGLDIVVIARNRAATLETDELFASFEQCLRRLQKKIERVS